MSLGMTLIRTNTLAFGLIGTDGPHGIIKICFGNMNLVFGSEVALLGFWEYMFQLECIVAIPSNTSCETAKYWGLISTTHYNAVKQHPLMPPFPFPWSYEQYFLWKFPILKSNQVVFLYCQVDFPNWHRLILISNTYSKVTKATFTVQQCVLLQLDMH